VVEEMTQIKMPEMTIEVAKEMLQYRFDKKIDYHEAFLKAQMEFPDIHKNKSGARSSYADLGAVYDAAIPVLNANGIHVQQEVTYHKDTLIHIVITKLTHSKTGQIDEFETLVSCRDEDFKNKITLQVYGSSYTYVKRYALASKLCLFADKDTDGATENKKYNNTGVSNTGVSNTGVSNNTSKTGMSFSNSFN